jgi:hypothetical protein
MCWICFWTSFLRRRRKRASEPTGLAHRAYCQPLYICGFVVEMEITVKSRLAEAAAFLDAEDFPQITECLKQEEERAERKRKRDAERRERGRHVVDAWFRKNPCVDCGNSDVRILEADHVLGRNFTISENLWRPVRKLEAELELCESRCANCHRLRHHADREQSRELSVDELL